MITVTLVIAVISLAIAGYALKRSNDIRLSSVYTELSQQANAINDAFLTTKIPTPYMHLLNIEQDKDEFIGVSVMFFHHLQLLNMVYRNRELLGIDATISYANWANRIFKPWIFADQRLVILWRKVREDKDIYGTDFVDWLVECLDPDSPNQ